MSLFREKISENDCERGSWSRFTQSWVTQTEPPRLPCLPDNKAIVGSNQIFPIDLSFP